MLTGEPLHVEKGPGDPVTGGAINEEGAFIMTAEHVGAETMLARIVQMVAEAQRSQAPIQKKVDQVAAWFVPTVLAVAVLAFVFWSFRSEEHTSELQSLMRISYAVFRLKKKQYNHTSPVTKQPYHTL